MKLFSVTRMIDGKPQALPILAPNAAAASRAADAAALRRTIEARKARRSA